MILRNKKLSVFLAVCFMGLVFFMLSCGSRIPYAGKYISQTADGQQAFIELKMTGEGIWFMADEEAIFYGTALMLKAILTYYNGTKK